MHAASSTYVRALAIAQRFFARCPDDLTVSYRDDFAQRVAIETWSRHAALREPAGLPGYVRTVARRLRARAFARTPWWMWRDIQQIEDVAEPCQQRRAGWQIDGEWFADADVRRALVLELGRLDAINRGIVCGYYEGETCIALAERFGLGALVVKVRLYRSRQRLRRGVVRRLHAEGCGSLDDGV